MFKSSKIRLLLAALITTAVLITCILPLMTIHGGSRKPSSMPVISRNVPAYSSSSQSPAHYANDNNYNTDWRSSGQISVSNPAWLAYDLSGVQPSKRNNVLAVWYNTITFNYDHTYFNEPAYNNISDYTIEGNKAPGGSFPGSGWYKLTGVNGNVFHSRQHLINLAGYNWIRIRITKPDGSSGNYDASINFDIHDAASGASDSWLFMGDSITAYTMPVNDRGSQGLPSFSQMIGSKVPGFFPAQEAAGIGGTKTDDALKYIDTYLGNFPGRYVCLSYGTNDINNNPSGIEKAARNYELLVNKIIQAGKLPVIPQIPWAKAKGVQDNAPALNSKIRELYSRYPQIIKGPDLWNIFYNKPHLFFDDLHPNPDGIRTYREAWANAMYEAVYR